MCGLYGVIQYGKGNASKVANVKVLVEKLAHGAAVRGTHATGIAYVNTKKDMVIDKAPEASYRFNGYNKIPAASRTIMGHTRHTTQGSEKKNYNNHPFLGLAGNKPFAFAHNGVLDNDNELQRTWNLPETKIETDSFVGVQLIEKQGKLNMESVKWMAEQVEGMFCFTIVDHKQQLWVIKNDSPMNIVHLKSMEMYVYASTADILHEALLGFTPTRSLVLDILRGRKQAADEIEYIEPVAGDILLFKQDGTIEKERFSPQERFSKYQNRWLKQQANGGATTVSSFDSDDWYYSTSGNYSRGHGTYGTRYSTTTSIASVTTQNRVAALTDGSTKEGQKSNNASWYGDYLKGYAHSLGHADEIIDQLREKGAQFDEIEDALYMNDLETLCTTFEVPMTNTIVL
jgi:glucosamine 6-phosphate synthetase-like amidotransferase/phosphosugar isomerase protein